MTKKIPKTELEVELFCDKIILLEKNRKLKLHLEALQEALKEMPIKQVKSE